MVIGQICVVTTYIAQFTLYYKPYMNIISDHIRSPK